MTRTFFHSFDPPASSPVSGATVDLEVSEIEDAGIREVLQTPGATYGAWSILDALLTPTGAGTPFGFREPLGQAREVSACCRTNWRPISIAAWHRRPSSRLYEPSGGEVARERDEGLKGCRGVAPICVV
ncbi:hypothetical protein [Bosea sp. UNC402CLCol]|uniref:hypothetical protein n=1 Tax=Bosea sp. UNC402CLCol TaxID=1510531 RepID=UPI0020BD8D00|nr:hypothetical protein [Bosea sp. UNC402CLCol]